MLKAAIVSVVDFCTRYAYATIAISLLITGIAVYYTGEHFAINTDVTKLISKDVRWRQQELAFDRLFPDRSERYILVVVDAPTSELASLARAELADKLAADRTVFTSVTQPGASAFFRQNGLLFVPTEELAQITKPLARAALLIRSLVVDPSLRGVAGVVGFVLAGVSSGQTTLDQVAGGFDKAAATIENVLAGRPASFSWNELLNGGKPPTPGDLRKFIQATPVLDFNALEPGRHATDAIRAAAASLDLASRYQARVRLTGPVPIENEEFGTVREGAALNGVITVAVVLLILWMALRSLRIIIAVVIALFIGLSATAALGLAMVGALNLISVAFAVLFVGLGVDFGLQFSVRYRQERFKEPDLRKAIVAAAARAGVPLTLAATAVACGFLSFLPTDYRGVSELGQIAGAGMLIAYVTSITVLPALLYVLHPPGEPEALGIAALAPVDDFLERHRIPIVVAVLGIAIAGLPLLYFLRFDLNPMNLRSPKVESVATYLDLRRDPTTGANAINIAAPSVGAAGEIAQKLEVLPEVNKVTTIASFVPGDQTAKLALIADAAKVLDPVLGLPARPAPTDAEIVEALTLRADGLTRAAENKTGRGADAARRLAAAMTRLAKADPGERQRAEAVFTLPLKLDIADLRDLLKAMPITLDNLPADLSHSWRSAGGQARIEVIPSGDPDNSVTMRKFADAVLAVDPDATGGPISILESGRTVITAFIEAGAWALLSIAILLWITLRRFGDVLLTLVPLLLAGVVTLEICVLIRMPLNFANIIALPLLLGIGVAFKIYFVMAWRSGRTKLLQSSLTRAVIFSAATTATAFGSLWFSSHPGTSSMGKLLALSLACTLAAAVLFQPALMGRPRTLSDQ
jgi:hopanoid biosynthesis associated RND transporter like protein HpnN